MTQSLSMLPKLFLNALYQQVRPGFLLTDPADCWLYSYDNSRHQALPGAVVFATTTKDVQALVKCCYEFSVPLVVRGRGTGTPGGAVPVQGGVVLSLEKMNSVITLDKANRFITAETGVLNQTVQDVAKTQGFFWPPDPGSAAYCSIGGNLGYNAAGPRALKYGSTRDNVLRLQAVTGTGEIIHTGAYTTKSATGYDLTRLLIGSEGTLAVITQATLKLVPLPAATNTIRLIYQNAETALKAVTDIMASSFTPAALEFMDEKAVQLIRQQQVALSEKAGALLLISVDGLPEEIRITSEAIIKAGKNSGLIDYTIAENLTQSQNLWAARKALSPALRAIAPKKINEDIVVPVSNMPALLRELETLSVKYTIPMVNFGHAGNGNIHVNLMINPDDKIQLTNAEKCLEEIFATVVTLKGTLSGEHGIGIEKRAFLEKNLEPAVLQLMRQIKKQFDPKGILNPGKIFL